MCVTPSAASSRRWGTFASGTVITLALLICCVPALVYAQAAQDAPSAAQPNADPEAEPVKYSARGHVTQATPSAEQLTTAESRDLTRHMGPTFSYVETLPGVVPVFSGVPYVIVRGASPGGSLTYYDGMQLPALFHLALGPSIVDPWLAGPMRLFSAAAPTRFAAHSGAVMDQLGPSTQALATPLRSLELSLLDTAGRLNVPTGHGALAISFRYGNPSLMLRALGLDATLGYHDFQVRYQTALSAHTQLTLVLLGAEDHLGERTVPADDIDLAFQRVMARLTTRVANVELGSQLVLSNDDSKLGQAAQGHALRATESVYAQWRDERWRLRAGADLSSALVLTLQGRTGATLSRDFALDPEDFVAGQPFTSVPSRNLIGAYTELHLMPVPLLHIELGLRADGFSAGSYFEGALSPMLRASLRPSDQLELHAAAALTNRPHSSPVPIPGLTDLMLDRGLERAFQSELGGSLRLGQLVELELTLFYHRYYDAVYMELILDCQGNTSPELTPRIFEMTPGASICRGAALPTADGETYGVEMFAKRDLTQRLSGYLSYTLSFADAVARDGTPFVPQSDVRHMLNMLVKYDLGRGFTLGARLHLRTGKMAVNTAYEARSQRFLRFEYRLPGFLRLDLRLSYAFAVSFGAIELSLALQNATFSREAIKRDCYARGVEIECVVDYQPYIVLPNFNVRADF